MTAILPKELLTATLGGLSLLVVSGGSDGDVLVQQSDGTYAPETLVTGDVFGPASSTDNAIARFDATTGKLLQNCVVTIGDTGNIAGLGTVSCGAITASGIVSVASIESSKSNGKSIRAISNATEVFGVGPAYISGSYYDRTHITTNRFSYWSFSSAGSSLIFGEDPTLPAVGAASISGAASGGFGLGSGAELSWYNNSSISSGTVDAKFSRSGTAIVDLRADNGFRVRNLADSADAALTCGAITASGLVCMSIYTVATLPSASANAYKEANVSDALAPAMGVAVVGGGSVKTKVRSNGTDWTVCGI